MMMAPSEDYGLKIRQQPKDALLAQDGKEKSKIETMKPAPASANEEPLQIENQWIHHQSSR